MAFEVYHPRMRGTNNAPKPVVRLSKLSLVLNKVAREKLNSPEFVELAFDSDASTIRIKPADKAGGVQVKKTKVFAKGFFEHFAIKASGNYFADYNAEENAVYVKIA
jgi:hypothetical protein